MPGSRRGEESDPDAAQPGVPACRHMDKDAASHSSGSSSNKTLFTGVYNPRASVSAIKDAGDKTTTTSTKHKPEKKPFQLAGVFQPASEKEVQKFKTGVALPKQEYSVTRFAEEPVKDASVAHVLGQFATVHSPPRSPDESSSSSNPHREFKYPARVGFKTDEISFSSKKALDRSGASQPNVVSQTRGLDKSLNRSAPRGLRRNDTIIQDRNILETRWDWNKLLVQKAFKPYRAYLCKHDDQLPNDPEELDTGILDDLFDDDDGSAEADQHRLFHALRDQMLGDGKLSEREIAAFFEGLTILNVKVKSLEVQLQTTKILAATPAVGGAGGHGSFAFRRRSFHHTAHKTTSDTTRTTSLEPLLESLRKSAITPDAPPPLGSPDPVKKSAQKKPTRLAAKVAAEGGGDVKSVRTMSIIKHQKDPSTSPEHLKLLEELAEAEKARQKLEKQLKQAGIQIAEDIPYDEAKSKVETIAARMGEIGSADVVHEDKAEQAKLREEYFKLEQDMEKYNVALTLTDEYIEEQEELEAKWERDNLNDNIEALKKLRRHMPVEVKSMSEAQLSSQITPNGKVLPKDIAKKFKRTNVLQLLRSDPDDIVKMHPSTLENYRVTGMTLTERRAMYAHLQDIGPKWKAMSADAMTERKWTWFGMMKENFKSNLEMYNHHVAKYGPPGNHPYLSRKDPDKGGCPMIGKQCPLRADRAPSYEDDYGFTDEAIYEVSTVKKADVEDSGAKAIREAQELARDKRANERSDILKKHYKGKVLQVSLANGSCESMDATLDSVESLLKQWIECRVNEGNDVSDEQKRKEVSRFSDALNELKLSVLQYAERSGMQLTGKKDTNADKIDIRSSVELGLCEEVCNAAIHFFSEMEERMEQIGVKDGRMKSSINQLREFLDELHERNINTLKHMGVENPPPSRKTKTRKEMEKEAREQILPVVEESVEEEDYGAPPQAAMAGRGGLMAAIAGRGGGGGGDSGGRGDLMSAIAGRGRGRGGGGGRGDLMSAIAGRGRGGGDSGGRGDLMSAIAGRGRGRGGDSGGGRGDLMSAIAGRGRGRGGDSGGGRGDLMSAIAARGRGRGGRGGDAGGGGRGDLMSAIAARGRGRGGNSSADSGGGRGDLMAAIAGRGRGRGGRSDDGGGGGRGDLMSEIAARGGGRGRGSGGRGNFLDEIKAKAAEHDQD